MSEYRTPDPQLVRCPDCIGTGWVPQLVTVLDDGSRPIITRHGCEWCHGEGWVLPTLLRVDGHVSTDEAERLITRWRAAREHPVPIVELRQSFDDSWGAGAMPPPVWYVVGCIVIGALVVVGIGVQLVTFFSR